MNWHSPPVRAGIVGVIGILVIGFTVWRTHPAWQKRTAVNYAKAKYMHCPECMAEVRFDPDKMDLPCVQCGAEKGMVVTEESIKKTGTRSRYGKLVAFVMPEVCLLLTALWFVLRPRAGAENEDYRYMRCANCSQKLRFRTAQVGAAGACSRCKRPFLFPEGTTQEEDLDDAAVDG